MAEARKLTKRIVDALKADTGGKDVIHFDSEVRGFGVRVKPSGAKSYVLKYRNRFGQQRKFHIARVGEITPDQARDRAIKLRGRIADGGDPAAERAGERGAITVGELCDQYLENGVGRIKASTLAVDKSRIERHVKPLLGSRPVMSLTATDMEKFLKDVIAGKHVKVERPAAAESGKRTRGGVARGGRGVASRTLGMLGTILQGAVRAKIIAENPVRGIKRPKDKSADPPFSFERVERVGKAMREAVADGDNEIGIRALRHLILTGGRRQEGLGLQWGTVDRAAKCFRYSDTKTGQQIRAIGRGALDNLTSFEPKAAKPTDFVFPGAGRTGYLVGLPKIWARIAKRAGIEKSITINGLRHWYASAATELGYSDLVVGALIGHAKRGITARYATAPDPVLISAADRVSSHLLAALDGKQPAENVTPLRVA